jgi:colanic acid/amylovoran biosynthesis glycosyltransferase
MSVDAHVMAAARPAAEAGARLRRVLVVVNEYPAAMETFIAAQVRGLVRRGVEVEVLARHRPAAAQAGPGEEPAAAVRYADLPRRRLARALRAPALLVRGLAADGLSLAGGWGPRGLALAVEGLSLAPLLADAGERYDAVLCHFGPNGRALVGVRRLLGFATPVATAFHGFDVSSFLRRGGRSAYAGLFAQGDLFLPVSDFWRRRLLELGCPPERTLTHHMGVEVSRFGPRSPVPGAPFGFILAARLVEKKGVGHAIRAFARCRQAMPARRARLTILGDGPLRRPLEALAARLAVGGEVSFLGEVPPAAVAAHLAAADCFVLPSITAANGDMEGIPTVLMEAMATGLPVIASRHSGVPELVEHGRTGLLAEEGDAATVAAHMAAVLRNPEAHAAMGRRGRRVVERSFSADVQNETLIALLAGLAARRQATGTP